MTEAPLQGVGVLVTRPRAQAAELIASIQEQGGNAICFPVIEIVPREASSIAKDAAALPAADIALFVSQNAVAFGLAYTSDTIKSAIGPATAAAIQALGQQVEISPASGFDSESLLDEPGLRDVEGKSIWIIRGDSGREMLADTLRSRGARVSYLSVYSRELAKNSPESLAALEASWRDGKIQAITIMSVETLRNLTKLLPEWCAEQLENVRLVTPAARVIKEVLDRYPASRPILASGTQAADMVNAIIATIASKRTDPGLAP